ncbi:hypothetical protein ACG7TL_003248 [Trametes sanguinea]
MSAYLDATRQTKDVARTSKRMLGRDPTSLRIPPMAWVDFERAEEVDDDETSEDEEGGSDDEASLLVLTCVRSMLPPSL